MKVLSLITALITLPLLCFSQSQTVKYYKNMYLTKEVSEKKGKYILTTTENKDGSTTKEIKEIKSGILLLSETLKDGKPHGTWIDKISRPSDYNKLNYGFNVTYSKEKCTNSMPINSNTALMFSIDSTYQPPVLAGYSDFNQYLAYNLVYPANARGNAIQGEILLSYTITEKGEITNIVVNQSVHKHLDKEAVRVIREMKIKEPAKFEGKDVSICVSLPINFTLG